MVLVLVVMVEIYYEHVIGDGVIFMAGSSGSGNSKKEEDEGEAVSLLLLMLRRLPLLYYYGVGTDTVVDECSRDVGNMPKTKTMCFGCHTQT